MANKNQVIIQESSYEDDFLHPLLHNHIIQQANNLLWKSYSIRLLHLYMYCPSECICAVGYNYVPCVHHPSCSSGASALPCRHNPLHPQEAVEASLNFLLDPAGDSSPEHLVMDLQVNEQKAEEGHGDPMSPVNMDQGRIAHVIFCLQIKVNTQHIKTKTKPQHESLHNHFRYSVLYFFITDFFIFFYPR